MNISILIISIFKSNLKINRIRIVKKKKKKVSVEVNEAKQTEMDGYYK